jgi:DNA polymerase V|tara:strand:- start:1347 stop:1775 length:429 start_codon:yes stop_codon:yes gene_type:complete
MILQALTPSCVPIKLTLPLYSCGVAAGFPSPAEDHVDRGLDLNEHLIQRPSSTYFARACGDSMQGVGIYNGDLLVIDRSLTAEQGDTVIASVDGELTCKIFDINNRQLLAANPEYPAIPLPDETDLIIEGVVAHAIHHLRRG